MIEVPPLLTFILTVVFFLFFFPAAFDDVHGILIEELFHCGTRDSTLAPLKSYLED